MSGQEDLWEQPKSKGWRTKKQPASSPPANARPQKDARLQSERPKRIVAGLNVEKLAEEFAGMEKRWERTACSAHVQRILRKRKWNIGSAVCIGIGSFSIDWEHRYRSMWQLVLFIAVVRQCKYCLILLIDQREPFLTAEQCLEMCVSMRRNPPSPHWTSSSWSIST